MLNCSPFFLFFSFLFLVEDLAGSPDSSRTDGRAAGRRGRGEKASVKIGLLLVRLVRRGVRGLLDGRWGLGDLSLLQLSFFHFRLLPT